MRAVYMQRGGFLSKPLPRGCWQIVANVAEEGVCILVFLPGIGEIEPSALPGFAAVSCFFLEMKDLQCCKIHHAVHKYFFLFREIVVVEIREQYLKFNERILEPGIVHI